MLGKRRILKNSLHPLVPMSCLLLPVLLSACTRDSEVCSDFKQIIQLGQDNFADVTRTEQIPKTISFRTDMKFFGADSCSVYHREGETDFRIVSGLTCSDQLERAVTPASVRAGVDQWAERVSSCDVPTLTKTEHVWDDSFYRPSSVGKSLQTLLDERGGFFFLGGEVVFLIEEPYGARIRASIMGNLMADDPSSGLKVQYAFDKLSAAFPAVPQTPRCKIYGLVVVSDQGPSVFSKDRIKIGTLDSTLLLPQENRLREAFPNAEFSNLKIAGYRIVEALKTGEIDVVFPKCTDVQKQTESFFSLFSDLNVWTLNSYDGQPKLTTAADYQ